jgi:hypothetical protein
MIGFSLLRAMPGAVGAAAWARADAIHKILANRRYSPSSTSSSRPGMT